MRAKVADADAIVVVIAPVNAPREGYVVYDNTRRAAAGRRLDRTLTSFREAGIPATGHVVDNDPLAAVKDAIAIEEPDELIVSTHPEANSGWRRRNLLEEIRKAAGAIPVDHVVSDVASPHRSRERSRHRERDGARRAAARPHPREGAVRRRGGRAS